jgi:hypothetical protein
MVHTHYFLKPAEVHQLLLRVGILVVVGFRFDKASGEVTDGSYVKSGGVVSCGVGGNTYTHGDGEWLFNYDHRYPMHVHIEALVGSTFTAVVSVPPVAPEPPLVLDKFKDYEVPRAKGLLGKAATLILKPHIVRLDPSVVIGAYAYASRLDKDTVSAGMLTKQVRSLLAGKRMTPEEQQRHYAWVPVVALHIDEAQRADSTLQELTVQGFLLMMRELPTWFPMLLLSLFLLATRFAGLGGLGLAWVVFQWAVNHSSWFWVIPALPMKVRATCSGVVTYEPGQIRPGATLKVGDFTRCKERNVLTLVGPYVPWPIAHPACCAHDELQGLISRALMPVPEPLGNAFDSWPAFIRWLPQPDAAFTPQPVGDWLAHFPKTRRLALERALSRPDGQDAPEFKVKAFAKAEVYFKETFDVRLIQGTNLRYQIYTGPFVHSVSKHLASSLVDLYNNEAIDKLRVVYASGLDAEGLGQIYTRALEEIPEPVAIEIDASRFDAHVPAKFHIRMSEFYSKYMGSFTSDQAKEMLDVLSKQVSVEGTTMRGGHRYSVEGTRCSGTNDTSLGNSLLSAFIWWRAIRDVTGVLFVLGDDTLFIGCRDEGEMVLNRVRESYRDCGFVVKSDAAKLHMDATQATFCSGLFYPTADGHVFGPLIGRYLAKLFWKRDDVPTSREAFEAVRLAKGVAKGVSFIPILGDLVHSVASTDVGYVRPKPEDNPYKVTASHYHLRSRETYVFLATRYGLPIHTLEEMAHVAGKLPCRRVRLGGPFIRLCEVDLL